MALARSAVCASDDRVGEVERGGLKQRSSRDPPYAPRRQCAQVGTVHDLALLRGRAWACVYT